MAESEAESVVVHVKYLGLFDVLNRLTQLEFGYVGRNCKLVVRAAFLTFVATIDLIPGAVLDPFGQFAPVLYKLARQASRGIHCLSAV